MCLRISSSFCGVYSALITLSRKMFLITMMRRMTRVLLMMMIKRITRVFDNRDFDRLIERFVEDDSLKKVLRTSRMCISKIRIDDLIECHNDEMSKLMNKEVWWKSMMMMNEMLALRMIAELMIDRKFLAIRFFDSELLMKCFDNVFQHTLSHSSFNSHNSHLLLSEALIYLVRHFYSICQFKISVYSKFSWSRFSCWW